MNLEKLFTFLDQDFLTYKLGRIPPALQDTQDAKRTCRPSRGERSVNGGRNLARLVQSAFPTA